jgi:hypothetical protein
MVAGVLNAVAPWEERETWRPIKMLVDSGSQQLPLVSTQLAKDLKLRGRLVSAAAQADGGLLPLYDVGKLDLAVNGAPSSERFLSANITPYDVILGEDWCIKHKVILD